MNKNQEMINSMISTALHIKYENHKADSAYTIYKEAADIKNALEKLYPINDEQWKNILTNIDNYAEYLL